MRHAALLLVLLFLLGASPRARGDEKDLPAVDPALAGKVKKLVENLRDRSYAVREEACRALMELGPAARPVLLPLREDPSAEVRLRIARILLHYREIERRARMGRPAPGDWPTLRRTPGRGGSDGRPILRETPELRWWCQLPGRVGEPYFDAPLLVVEDRIVVVLRDGRVFSVDRKSGRIGWSSRTGERVFAGPVMAGGVIYIPGSSLTAMDARNGAVLWRVKTDYGVVASPLVSGGKVFFVEKGEKLRAVDPVSGTVLFEQRLPGTRSSPVAVGEAVILGTGRGVRAFRSSDGRRLWGVRTRSPVTVTPAALTDRIVVADDTGGLLAVGLEKGREIWRRRIPEGRVTGTPAVYGDSVLFATSGGTFRSIRAEDGGDRWTRFVGSRVVSSPCVAGGAVCFLAGPIFFSMECANGDDTSRLLFEELLAAPVIMDGRLYLLSEGGRLLAF